MSPFGERLWAMEANQSVIWICLELREGGGGGGESEKEEVNSKEEIETTDHLFCMFCKQILKS